MRGDYSYFSAASDDRGKNAVNDVNAFNTNNWTNFSSSESIDNDLSHSKKIIV